MKYEVQVHSVGPLEMNSILLTATGPEGAEAVLIDPGDEPERLIELVESSGSHLIALVATHGHFDHVGAGAAVADHFDLPLRCHPADLELIERMPDIQTAYGFPTTAVPRCLADLTDGQTIPCAGDQLLVKHVPGHSPGQIMLMWKKYAFVGDCLFAGSVGRTDLPGGDFAQLEKSIRETIYSLPDETIVVSGHGPNTTVGHEKIHNPFVRA